MKKLYAILLLVFFTPLLAFAQNEEMESDRPGESFTPQVVVKNRFQLEAGIRKEYDKTNGQNHELYLYPTSLLKYGLSKKFELHVLIEDEGDYDFMPDKQKVANGLKPVKVGFKYNLFEEKGCLPNTSVLARAAMPKLASKDFEGDYVAPAFRLLMENSLSKKWSLTYNIGVEWEPDDVHAQYVYTLSPQFDISEKLKVFAELYGFISNNESADHRCDAGLLYLIKPNFQIDISGGIGITKSSPDSFIEAGLSFRIPH